MEPLIIWRSPRKLRLVALAAILRGVVGVLYGAQLWLTIDLSNPASIVSIFCALILSVLGVTFALYAVLGIVVAVRLGRGPALVIDDRGVTDRTALGSVGFIPWEQALAFIPGRGTHKGFVIVRYAHPQWPEERLRGLGRALLWVNRSLGRFGLPPGPIATGTLDLDVVETARLLADQRALRRPELPPASGAAPRFHPRPCGDDRPDRRAPAGPPQSSRHGRVHA